MWGSHVSGLMQLYGGTILISSLSFLAEKMFNWVQRVRHLRDRRNGFISTANSTPCAAEKHPKHYMHRLGHRFPYHPVGASYPEQTQRGEAILDSYKPKAKRVLLLCDADGNALDLVYM